MPSPPGDAAGIPLFLINMAVSAWIKFAQYTAGAILMTVIMGIGLLYLALANLQWIVHLIQSRKTSNKASSLSTSMEAIGWLCSPALLAQTTFALALDLCHGLCRKRHSARSRRVCPGTGT